MPASKVLNFIVAIVFFYTLDKIIWVKQGHHLRKNIFASVHSGKYAKSSHPENQLFLEIV
jgi:hypothetical protein